MHFLASPDPWRHFGDVLIRFYWLTLANNRHFPQWRVDNARKPQKLGLPEISVKNFNIFALDPETNTFF